MGWVRNDSRTHMMLLGPFTLYQRGTRSLKHIFKLYLEDRCLDILAIRGCPGGGEHETLESFITARSESLEFPMIITSL